MSRPVLYFSMFIFIFGSSLHIVQIFSGFGLIESFKDPASMVLAISMPIAILTCIRILPSALPSAITTIVYLSIFLIWGYFTYQLTTYSDYRLTNIPGDISFGVDWLLNNKMAVGIYFLAFLVVIGLRRLGNAIGHPIGERIKESTGSSGND